MQPFHGEFKRTSRSFDKSLHMLLDCVIQLCEEGNLHQQHEMHSEAHQEAQVVQVTTEVMLDALEGRLIDMSSKRDDGRGASSYFMYVAKSVAETRIKMIQFSIC